MFAFDPPQEEEGESPLDKSLNSISRSLFSMRHNSAPKKDSPKKHSSRPPRGSPTSITSKQLNPDASIKFDDLAPESLFKLLKDLRWRAAVSRSAEFLDEASQWIVKYDEKNIKMLWKRLPIHEACIRQPTPEIIAALLDSYPSGAAAKDNQGRTPLHYAVIHGAHIDVVYLLLHGSYDVTVEKDFFYKVPRDYAHTTTFTHKSEVIAALTLKSRQDIASAASGVRVLLQASHPTHGAGLTLTYRDGDVSETSTLQEQLAQALTEVDAADTMRDVAMANEEVYRIQIRELKEKVVGLENQLKQDDERKERDKNCIFLLEKKQQMLVSAIATKDEEIKSLKSDVKIEKKQRQSEVVMRKKLKHTVSSLTENINASNKEVEYWKNEAGKIAALKNNAETKNESLEELVKVYQGRSKESEDKFNEVREHITRAEKTSMHTSNIVTGMAEKVAISKQEQEDLQQELSELKSVCTEKSNRASVLEQLLTTVEDERIDLEYKCKELEEDLSRSQEDVEAHKEIIKGYHDKCYRLQEAFHQVSGHLIERTTDLGAAKVELKKLEDEITRARKKCKVAEEEKEKELVALTNERDKAIENIKELESVVEEFNEDHQDLGDMCTEYEKRLKNLSDFAEYAESKIAGLEELVCSHEENNHSLEAKYKSCRLKLDACQEECETKVSSLEDLVRILREKVFESTVQLENEKKLFKKEKEKNKRFQKSGTKAEITRKVGYLSNNDDSKVMRGRSALQMHGISRERPRSEISSGRSHVTRRCTSRASAFDYPDDMTVRSSVSTRSNNSATSVSTSKSSASTRSALTRRSTPLAFRTQRALKHRISSRNKSFSNDI